MNGNFSWPTVGSTDCNKCVPDVSINCKLVALHDAIEEPQVLQEIMKPPGSSNFRTGHCDPEGVLPLSSFEPSTSHDPEITSILNKPLCIQSHIYIDKTSPKQRDVLESTGSSTWSQSFCNQCNFSPIADPFSGSESSIDATMYERSPMVSPTILGRLKEDASPNISTSSKTSSLLNKLIAIPPNTDER